MTGIIYNLLQSSRLFITFLQIQEVLCQTNAFSMDLISSQYTLYAGRTNLMIYPHNQLNIQETVLGALVWEYILIICLNT